MEKLTAKGIKKFIAFEVQVEEVKKKYKKQPINTVDGVKIEFDTEWVHLRKSNTEPIIRIYAESDLEVKADTLAKKIIMDIKEIIAEHVTEK